MLPGRRMFNAVRRSILLQISKKNHYNHDSVVIAIYS